MAAMADRICSVPSRTQLWLVLQCTARMDQMCAAARPDDKEGMKANAAKTTVATFLMTEEQLVKFSRVRGSHADHPSAEKHCGANCETGACTTQGGGSDHGRTWSPGSRISCRNRDGQ